MALRLGVPCVLSEVFAKLSSGPGNLIGKARSITALGAKAKKALPERFVAEIEPGTDNDADDPGITEEND